MGRTKQLFEELRQKELQEENFFNKKNITFFELEKTKTVTTAPNIK
mgnify:FL=1|jgi:hypothetical protein